MWGLGEKKEEREQGDKGTEDRSPASEILQLIILLKANKSKSKLICDPFLDRCAGLVLLLQNGL